MIRKAVIPAAGYGTRSLPITKAIPKEMFPVCGKPALHYVVEEAEEAGIREILIIVSRAKNAIIDYFDKSIELEHHLKKTGKSHLIDSLSLPKVHIQFTRQSEPRGLGAAVRLAEPFVGKEPFALLLPDDLFIEGKKVLKRMIRAYRQYGSPVIGLRRVEDATLLRNYGVIKGETVSSGLVRVTGIVEKPADKPPSDLAVTGRYVLPAEIFSVLHNTKPGYGGEVQLTDALQSWLNRNVLYGMEIKEHCYDISRKEEYINLQTHMYRKLTN